MRKYFYLVFVLLMLVSVLFLFSGCEFFDKLFGNKTSPDDNNSLVGDWEFYSDSDGMRSILTFGEDGSYFEKDYENGSLSYQIRGNYTYSDSMLTINATQEWTSDSDTWEDSSDSITLMAKVKDDEAWLTMDNNDDGIYDTSINIIYSNTTQEVDENSDYTIVFERL